MTLTGVDAARTAGRSRQKAKDDRRVWHGRGWVLSPENSPRAELILAVGGALISEFPPGTFAAPQNFPIHNRILSGMSIGVLVGRSRRIHRYAYYRWSRAGIPGGRTPGSNRAPSWLRPGKEVGADLARELRRALAPLDCLNPQKLAPHLYSQTKVRSS